MLSNNNIGFPSGKEVLSYNLDIDEKLSAFILRQKKRSKIFGIALPDFLRRKDKNIIWINNPQYHFNIVPLETYNKLFLNDIPIFISSCGKELVTFFVNNNFEVIKVGKEAILELNKNHFEKKSLMELVKAGLKHGKVEEIPYSLENAFLLEDFKNECAHGSEPQLKHFFTDNFSPDSRLFVFKDKLNQWQGGITISVKKDGKVNTELILRRKKSPRGTMEALVYSIFRTLISEGEKTWSLGEAPYVVYNSKIFSKEFFINFTGRRLRFAYNYLGLYNFKNKFNPNWADVYVCCKPRLTFSTLIKISWQSNMIKLICKKSYIKPIEVINKIIRHFNQSTSK